MTVAVWVGNFDGSAMRGTSGITGAAPLFHAAMEAAMRGREPHPLRLAGRVDRDEALVAVEVCPLSGGRPTRGVPARRRRVDDAGRSRRAASLRDARARPARPAQRAARGPELPCRGSRRANLRALRRRLARLGRRGGPAHGARPLLAALPGRARARHAVAGFASAGRATAPSSSSIRSDRARSSSSRCAWRPRRTSTGSSCVVDGQTVAHAGAPFVARWMLAPGDHVLVARARGGAESPPVAVTVQ